MHIKAALGLLLGRMKLCHKIEGLAAKKGVGERTSVRPGKPPPLHVTTVTRKNHNLTVITGLENYGPSRLPHLLLASCPALPLKPASTSGKLSSLRLGPA